MIGSFDEYVDACQEERERTAAVTGDGHLKGLSIGLYGEYVPQWLDMFEDRVRIAFFEELCSQPRALVSSLCRWLSIDDDPAGSFDYSPRNKTVNPRSMLLARSVFAAKKRFGRVLPRGTPVRKRLRAAYARANNGHVGERIDPSTRRRVAEIYGESNRTVAAALSDRGYDDLPEWLSGGR